jgi:hypothetical protein
VPELACAVESPTVCAVSAKKYSPAKKPQPVANATVAPAVAGAAPSATAPEAATAQTAWLDSADPRRRAIAKVVFVALWIYVAALWLLALDQWFNWGIFGPKIPPLP